MADEEKIENQEQNSEQKTEVVEEPEIHPSGLSMNKPSSGFLNKLTNILRSKKETEEVKVEETDEEIETEETDEENIESESTEETPEAEN